MKSDPISSYKFLDATKLTTYWYVILEPVTEPYYLPILMNSKEDSMKGLANHRLFKAMKKKSIF